MTSYEPSEAPSRAADPGPPPAARRLVAVTLAALLVAGLIGFDAWPLTAWRLFSLARDNSQTEWVLEAVSADGTTRTVTLEDLPLRYRQAAWPMAELPRASEARRQAVCLALVDPTADVVPELAELHIVRDRQHLIEKGGRWIVTHDPEVVHACPGPAAPPL
jgi:hypothetical protein